MTTIHAGGAIGVAAIEAQLGEEAPPSPIEARILAAATDIFGRRGFHEARTADIARAAGTTERTLFKYFPTKAALYGRALMPGLIAMTVIDGMRHTADLFAGEAGSFAAWQDRLLRARLEQSRVHQAALKMLLVTLLTDDEVRRWFAGYWRDKVWSGAVAAIERFQRQGLVRADVAPEVAARAVISLNLGLVLTRVVLAPELEMDEEAQIGATTALLDRALAG